MGRKWSREKCACFSPPAHRLRQVSGGCPEREGWKEKEGEGERKRHLPPTKEVGLTFQRPQKQDGGWSEAKQRRSFLSGVLMTARGRRTTTRDEAGDGESVCPFVPLLGMVRKVRKEVAVFRRGPVSEFVTKAGVVGEESGDFFRMEMFGEGAGR